MVTEVKSFLYAFCGRQRSLPEYETKPAGRDKNGWMSYFSTVAPTGFPYVGQGKRSSLFFSRPSSSRLYRAQNSSAIEWVFTYLEMLPRTKVDLRKRNRANAKRSSNRSGVGFYRLFGQAGDCE